MKQLIKYLTHQKVEIQELIACEVADDCDYELLEQIELVLPKLEAKDPDPKKLKAKILKEIWAFCEKEFKADFENDYIGGYGSKSGMSERTERLADRLLKKLKPK